MSDLDDIKAEENCELHAYPDPLSPLGMACRRAGILPIHWHALPNPKGLSGDPWTCGYGSTGSCIGPLTIWTQEKADREVALRVGELGARLRVVLPWFKTLVEPRQAVLVNMAYQMGLDGLLGFHHALSAMAAGDWARAYDALLDSDWGRQTPARAHRMAVQMLTGRRANQPPPQGDPAALSGQEMQT